MTCQHPNCSSHVFSSCTNHCMKNLCLKHLIEHGDLFVDDFTNLLHKLEKSTSLLTKKINYATTHINRRREYEIERLNHRYNPEQEELRNEFKFAEIANDFLKTKQQQVINLKQQNQCPITQTDFEQIEIYKTEINKILLKKSKISTSPSNVYSCPLNHPNAFGIKLEHNIRFDCDGSKFPPYNLGKHFENYHRMLPECASRLKNAIINDHLSEQTKLFSENEILRNEEYLFDCPLTNSTNIFGANKYIHTLKHIPCTKKQLAFPSLINHFRFYHKMKIDLAKKLFSSMKNKTFHPNVILFETNECLGTHLKKKK